MALDPKKAESHESFSMNIGGTIRYFDVFRDTTPYVRSS